MQCTNCKSEILATAKFCPECGYKVENKGKTCPNKECNRTGLSPEAAYCPDCGSDLAWAQRNSENNSFIGNSGTFVDERDGHEYKWVRIGTQIWMAENLAFKGKVGISVHNNRYDSYFGLKYTWEDAFKACPIGWRLPSRDEWNLLLKYLIQSGYNFDGTMVGNKVAKSLASKEGWKSSTGFFSRNLSYGCVGEEIEKNNRSGFNGLPGGECDKYGFNFKYMNELGAWWSSSVYNVDKSFFFVIGFDKSFLGEGSIVKDHGLSVRCVKD